MRNSPQSSVSAGRAEVSPEPDPSVPARSEPWPDSAMRRRPSTTTSAARSSRAARSSQAEQASRCSATSLSSGSGRSPSAKADRISSLGQAVRLIGSSSCRASRLRVCPGRGRSRRAGGVSPLSSSRELSLTGQGADAPRSPLRDRLSWPRVIPGGRGSVRAGMRRGWPGGSPSQDRATPF